MRNTFRRKTVKMSVADYILDAIISRELRPGTRILESQMANSLGVAKTTLREALIDLERQGVLMGSDNRGTYVTELTGEDVRDIYGVRIKLEPEAGVLAHRRISAPEQAELATLLERMRAAGLRKDYLNAQKADLAFHQLIWNVSGNLALEKALNAVSVPMFAFSGLYLLQRFAANPSDYARICNDHAAMLKVLKEGPPEKVRKVFEDKLEVFEEENWAVAGKLDSGRNQERHAVQQGTI